MADPFYTLALDLFPEVSAIISAQGAVVGGGGTVLGSINRILGLPEVKSRALAGRLFTHTRQAMKAGFDLSSGDPNFGAIAELAPFNPVLFGTNPEGFRFQYDVVIAWTDAFTGERRTALVPIETTGAVSLDTLLELSGAEVSQEYEIGVGDVVVGSSEIVAVRSIIQA